MAKKNKPQPQEPQQPAERLSPFPAPPPAPVPQEAQDVTRAQFWTFWAGVVAALVIARALSAALPGVSESVIERWVMVGFGAFLVLFLIKLK